MTPAGLEQAQVAFLDAASRVYLQNEKRSGIGTQGERMLHAILKEYLSPDPATQEQKVGRYIADIQIGDRILEVQTRRFDRLIPKLRTYLETYDVTVVYPIAHIKTLSWLDPVTGDLSQPRKSPKKGKLQDVLYEVFYLREFLHHPHFHIRVILCDMEEFRIQSGVGKDRKRHAPRAERIPLRLVEDVLFSDAASYATLLPDWEEYTVPRLVKEWKMYPTLANRAIRVWRELGILQEAGKVGRAKRYVRGDKADVL